MKRKRDWFSEAERAKKARLEEMSPETRLIHKNMEKLVLQLIDEGGSAEFHKLPSREENPHYYKKIKYPYDLSKIRFKLEDGDYEDFDALDEDFNLMIDNCLQYNEPGSDISKLAIGLRSNYMKRKKKLNLKTNHESAVEAIAERKKLMLLCQNDRKNKNLRVFLKKLKKKRIEKYINVKKKHERYVRMYMILILRILIKN